MIVCELRGVSRDSLTADSRAVCLAVELGACAAGSGVAKMMNRITATVTSCSDLFAMMAGNYPGSSAAKKACAKMGSYTAAVDGPRLPRPTSFLTRCSHGDTYIWYDVTVCCPGTYGDGRSPVDSGQLS